MHRSFQYVDDLIDGLIKLMNSDYEYPVNLGNPDEYTIKEFAEMICELTGLDPATNIIYMDGMHIYIYIYILCICIRSDIFFS